MKLALVELGTATKETREIFLGTGPQDNPFDPQYREFPPA